MGDHHLTPGKACLAAELRGSSELLSLAKNMACISRDQWQISHERHITDMVKGMTLTNRLPEEQWDRIIKEFSCEFEEVCHSFNRMDGHRGKRTPCGQIEPELRFRTTNNPEADTENSMPEVKLTDRVRVVHSQGSQPTCNSPSDLPQGHNTEIIISIEAGWAFGTGSHPSTVCSIMAMEQLYQHGSLDRKTSVLDMGTGTGILSIVAALMGAAEVTAVDIDEEALHYARHNVRQNNVQQQVKIISAQEWEEQASNTRYDICLANLTLSVATRLMPSLAPALKEGGILVLAGFKYGALPTVTHLLHRHGLCEETQLSHKGWCAVIASRAQE